MTEEHAVGNAQLILGLSVLAGALALDATAALQVMLSQPVVAGTIAGVVVGDPAVGLATGAALQLVWMGVLPVGAAPFPDTACAAVAAVGTAVLLGGSGVGAGLSVASGVMMGLAVGAVGQWLIAGLRRYNVRLAERAEVRASSGDAGGVYAAIATALAMRFSAGAVLTGAALTASLLLAIPLASRDVGGTFPTLLWAAPIAVAGIAHAARAMTERLWLVLGFAAGLVVILLG